MQLIRSAPGSTPPSSKDEVKYALLQVPTGVSGFVSDDGKYYHADHQGVVRVLPEMVEELKKQGFTEPKPEPDAPSIATLV